MWVEARSALRRFWLDLGPNLGSTRLSIVLMVVAALYHLFLAIWAGSSPPHVVRSIAGLLPYWLVYLLLLVNTSVCFWNRLPLVARDLARRRLGQLGSLLFHAAFLLVASGFLLTLVARQEAKIWVAVGETYEARDDQFVSRSPPRLASSGVPPFAFRLDRLTPRFWRDQLLFTELAADVVFADGSVRRTRINRPLWIAPATFLRLSGYGWAPRFELADQRGLRIDSAVIKLNLFPAGQRDHFVLPGFPHRVYLELYPDWAPEGDRPATRSMNLAAPAIVTEVYRGRFRVGEGALKADQVLEFEGLKLGFPEIVPWGECEIVRDPGAPVLFLGYLVGLLGLGVKLGGSLRPRPVTAGGEGLA